MIHLVSLSNFVYNIKHFTGENLNLVVRRSLEFLCVVFPLKLRDLGIHKLDLGLMDITSISAIFVFSVCISLWRDINWLEAIWLSFVDFLCHNGSSTKTDQEQ